MQSEWIFFIYNNASFIVILQLIHWLDQLASRYLIAHLHKSKIIMSDTDQFLSLSQLTSIKIRA